MTMKNALELSIQHWRDNLVAEHPRDASTSFSACALCNKYRFEDTSTASCTGCPVAGPKLQNQYCRDTPYPAAARALDDWQRSNSYDDRFQFRKAAQDMLNYLSNLATPSPTFDPTLPVATRDGRKARIICTDRVSRLAPIVALITCENDHDQVMCYSTEGRYLEKGTHSADLVNIPETRTYYLNIHDNGRLFGYPTEEEARQQRLPHKRLHTALPVTITIPGDKSNG